MIRIIAPLLVLLLDIPALLADSPAPARPERKAIECYCTDSTGGRVEMGETICLTVGGRSFLARCEMSVNVPMWRDQGTGCVSSHLRPAPTPRPAPARG